MESLEILVKRYREQFRPYGYRMTFFRKTNRVKVWEIGRYLWLDFYDFEKFENYCKKELQFLSKTIESNFQQQTDDET